jgi:hypothetical protein
MYSDRMRAATGLNSSAVGFGTTHFPTVLCGECGSSNMGSPGLRANDPSSPRTPHAPFPHAPSFLPPLRGAGSRDFVGRSFLYGGVRFVRPNADRR